MYKKYKRLVYTPPNLSARFCKVNQCLKQKIQYDFFILASLLDRGMQPINYNVPPRPIVSLITGLYRNFFLAGGGGGGGGGAVQLNSNVIK